MFPRIVCDPAILGGKPCVKGTRLSVEFLLELAAGGAGAAEIARLYPQVSEDDVKQAFAYAAQVMGREIVLTRRAAG